MKEIPDLVLGFRDAENYKRREDKELFNRIFVRTPSLEKLCDQHTFFLVGEKGTGKTAYASYLANNNYKETQAEIRFIRETEYRKFLALKKSRQLDLSDYTNIWKVILYVLLSDQIRKQEKGNPLFDKFIRFRQLSKAVDEYYKHAFSPEIIYAIQFAEEANISAKFLSDYVEAGGANKKSISFQESRFQTNLLYIQQHFEKAFTSLKLQTNHVLFVDGIDIRPSDIPQADYLDCVKGLANAVWAINNDFFANIKGSQGRMRVVLLIRPDILDSLGLQNLNSKLHDNAVILDWRTTYAEYRQSDLFALADQLLGSQQKNQMAQGEAWDHYFPYDAPDIHSEHTHKSSFISFLRFALFRPRNIITMLDIQKGNFIEQKRNPSQSFSVTDFTDPAFTRKYSDYLLGEVKDQLAFNYSDDDYRIFLGFFQYLRGQYSFSYEEYLSLYAAYDEFLQKDGSVRPGFCRSSDSFLQFLYDLNVICYILDTDDRPFFGYCHRERTLSNIAPRVQTHARYEVHFGLRKALDLGKRFNSGRKGR